MSSDNEHSGIASVLIATDGSAHAEAAVEYGAWVAARTRAGAIVLHVIDARRLAGHFITHFSEVVGGRDESAQAGEREEGLVSRVREYYRARGQQLLERAAVICERYDVACRTELETGFLGSVAEKVVRKVERPVLMAQPPLREFRRALLAFDGSAAARRAMQALARLAVALRMEGADVWQAFDRLEALARLAVALRMEGVDAVELVEWNEPTEALTEVLQYFKDYPVHVSAHYLKGDSLSVILDHAREAKCDLLAMGACADRTAESLGLGSTTEYLMRNSAVPVLVHH
jgi:nucleotide-binding universal stress UspA family protein